MKQVIVLLAAGAGSRFRDAGHKLLADLSGSTDTELDAGTPDTVLARSLKSAIDSGVGPVVLVTGALDPTVDLAVRELIEDADVVVAHNPNWQLGQSTSLRTGIDVARSLGAAAVCVGLGDQPFIEPESWRRVAAGASPISVANYDGRRGNPVRLAHEVWPLLATEGDQGARSLIKSRPDLVVAVPCTGSPADIDTVEDLRRWQSN